MEQAEAILQEAKEQQKLIEAVNPALWIINSKIVLPEGIFSFKNHEYLFETYTSDVKIEVTQKATQGGFPLSCDTPIPTPNGWVLMGEIKIGQKVFGFDGKIYTTKGVHEIKYGQKCYEVVFSDKSSIICDANHLWLLTDEWHYRYKKTVIIRTDDIKRARKKGKRNRYVLDVAKPLEIKESTLPIDPYLFGLWLGDGHKYSMTITGLRSDLEEYCKSLAGYEYVINKDRKKYPHIGVLSVHGQMAKIRKLDVFCNKHIPMCYLRASYKQRLSLLQGLMDTDGHITKKGKCEFYNINKVLLGQVYELLMSLGIKAVLSKKSLSTNWGATKKKDYYVYRISFRAYSDQPVFRLQRKYIRQKSKEGNRASETQRRRIIAVNPVDSVPVRCITVNSPDHLFLAGESFIPVHNSVAETLINLHGCKYGKFKAGVAVIMPTQTDYEKFSKAKYDPIIRLNYAAIGKFVKSGGKGTDAANLKSVGNSHIHFISATASRSIEGDKTSSAFTSFSCDKVVFDELDQMDLSILETVRGRMHHSELQQERYLSNPTGENYGINAMFLDSDQRLWHNLCHKCLKFTCPVDEFLRNPEKIIRPGKDGNKGYLVCVHCGTPLFLYYHDAKTGKESQWIAQYPDKPIVGRLWSGLNSYFYDPYKILKDYYEPPEGNIRDVMRNSLGLAYTAKEEQLRASQVYECCTNEPQCVQHLGPCIMGVDVGIKKHVVIGARTGKDRFEIFKTTVVAEWSDIHDLAKKFNVKVAGIDIAPDIDAAKQFQKQEQYQVWLVDYKTTRHISTTARDMKNYIIKANRTEICDATHRLITEKKLSLPRQCTVEEFAKQVCNPFKQEIRNEKTGIPEYRYVGKNDHFRHALNYFYVAGQNARVVKSNFSRNTGEQFVTNDRARYI